MPNHIHALIGFQNTGKSINAILVNGKRMAYETVERLEKQYKNQLLNSLPSGSCFIRYLNA